MRVFAVWIPVAFPGRNVAERAARANKYAGAELKKRFTAIACVYVRSAMPRGWVPLEKYGVEFRWVCVSCRQDPDNVTSGCKYVLDGMVRAGLVAGDGWRNVQAIKHSFTLDRKSGPGVEVVVTKPKPKEGVR